MSGHYGKYRGKVENNVDPFQQGRLQVSVPAVFGDGRLSWALPCVPYAGSQVGFFAVPPVGANVWVEFEGGDSGCAIWSGCFWGDGECPASPALADNKLFKTDTITLQLNDLAGGGGLTIEVKPPAVTATLKLVMNSSGIELSNGSQSVKLTMASVSVNNGALEVM
jgi:type VI secretion system (T6SS) baseplate-like injector VgrG